MSFAFHEMSAQVRQDPKGAADKLRALAVDDKLTGDQIAEKFGVQRRTLSRWLRSLRAALGEDGLGFKLAEGRRRNPCVSQAPPTKSKQRKKRW